MGGTRFAYSPCGSSDGITVGICTKKYCGLLRGFTIAREALVKLHKGKRFAPFLFYADKALLPDGFGDKSLGKAFLPDGFWNKSPEIGVKMGWLT